MWVNKFSELWGNGEVEEFQICLGVNIGSNKVQLKLISFKTFNECRLSNMLT